MVRVGRDDPRALPAVAGSMTTGLGEGGDTGFDATVSAVTSAFGDPTRRRIYLFLREQPEGATASEVAGRFDLHANVARHHLDKLAGGGYLTVRISRPPGAAGRPSKRYQAAEGPAPLAAARQGNDLLAALLGGALSLLSAEAAETMAEDVGESYGRRLAATLSCGERQRSSRAAAQAVADALTAHGFDARTEARDGSLALVKQSCPFFDVARQHPVICAVDRGMVRGMLAGLAGTTIHADGGSRALGDESCITFLRPGGPQRSEVTLGARRRQPTR